MARIAGLTVTFDDCSVIEEYEDDPQAFAGNEFDDMSEHDCIHDGGHLFLTSFGETKCVHCGKISWT
jgi:hypothetical protein